MNEFTHEELKAMKEELKQDLNAYTAREYLQNSAPQFVLDYVNQLIEQANNTTSMHKLVFAGNFNGKEIYTTAEVKEVLDRLNSEIKYLRGQSDE